MKKQATGSGKAFFSKLGTSCNIQVKFTDGQFAGWEGIAVDEADNKGFVYINISSVEANVGLRYPAMWCEAIGETAN